jgi:hypothetical protein
MNPIFTFLLMVMAAPALAADLRELDHQVDNVVVRTKGADKSAVEYRKARTIHFVDVDGDGVQDAIVFFTIEGMAGGNNYEQYLTILKGQPSGFLLLDTALIGGGSMGGASYEPPAIKERRITIQRTEYADEDSRCCPSIKSNITLVLQGSKLVEVPKHK